MKKVTLLCLLIIGLLSKSFSQNNVNVSGGFGNAQQTVTTPAYACQPNIFILSLTFQIPVVIKPDSTLYLMIEDKQGIQFPSLTTLPRVNAVGFHFAALFHNTTNANVALTTFTDTTNMFVTCDLIKNNSSATSITHTIGVYNDGAPITTSFAGNFNGSAINGNQISYPIYFPYLTIQSPSQQFEVDYLTQRLPNNTVTRTLSYVNQGGDTTDMLLNFNFSDSLPCRSFHFSNIAYQINAGGIIPITTTVHDSAIHTISPTSIYLKRGDVLHIIESITFLDNCFLNVPNTDINRTFHAKLDWGCSDLCMSILDEAFIVRGQLRPLLQINRIEPFNTATIINGTSDSYWDTLFSIQPTTYFRFRLANRGNDVINNVSFDIMDRLHSSMYFVTDSNAITVTRSFQGNRNEHSIAILFDTATSNRRPWCVIHNFPNAISHFIYFLDYLLPNDSIDFVIPITYCCPSNDIGPDTSTIDLFKTERKLNTWGVTAQGSMGCADQGGLAIEYVSNPPLLNITSHQFSMNDFNSAEPDQVYLKQNFIPKSISFSVVDPAPCSTPKAMSLDNFQFSQGVLGNYKWNDANMFTKHYVVGGMNTVVIDGLSIRFVIKTEPGLMIDTSPLNYSITANGKTWVASTVNLLRPENCPDSNVYTITFNHTNFPFIAPANRYLIEVFDMLSSGAFHFNIKGCCCTGINENPNYLIETWIAGYDQCFLPIYKVLGNSEIHCPGCNMPGTIVKSGEDSILMRTNYGYKDIDDNGLAEFPLAQIDTGYINAHGTVMDLNHSMVGDTLSSTMKVRLDDTGDTTLVDLANLGIHLKYLYAEQVIEKSNTSKFDVHPFQLTITGRNQIVTINQNSPYWGQILKDVRDSLTPDTTYFDILFYNLSESVLSSIFNIPNYTFVSNEEITLQAFLRVCKNYQPDRNSKALADNQFSSKVNLNMYWTDVNLDSLHIYDAFTHHDTLYPVAQNFTNIAPNRLYMCETRAVMHYFYSIYAKTITGVIGDVNSPCTRNLTIDQEVSIGGEKQNPFRYEYRPIPEFYPIQIMLPGAPANYQFFGNGKSTSWVRTYFTTSCGISNSHMSTTQPNLVFNSSYNCIHTQASEQLIATNAFPMNCNAPFSANSNNFYSSDEYLKQTIIFPLSFKVCSPTTTAVIVPSTITTQLHLSPCSQNALTLLSQVNTNYNTITNNYVRNFELSPPLHLIATQNRLQWGLRVHDIDGNDSRTRNLFVFFADTSIYSNISIDTITPQQKVLPNGKRIVFFKLGDQSGPPFDITRSLQLNLNSCSIDSIPFYIGFDCLDYPTLQALQNATICQFDTGYLHLNIQEPRFNEIIDSYDTTHSTCEMDTINAAYTLLGSNVYNFHFKLDVLNPSMQIIAKSIYHRDSTGAVVSVPFTTQFFPPYHYELIPNLPPNSYVPGDILSLQVIFSMLDTASHSPLSIDYSYTNLCGAVGPPAVIDTVHHRPLFIGTYKCSRGIANCFQIMAQQNTINCSGSAISISTSFIGHATNLSYVWSSIPAGYSSTGSTISPSPTVSTTYIVVATDQSGTTSSASVTVIPIDGQCCIPPNFNLANGDILLNNTSASAYLQLHYANIISTQNKIYIVGTFTVDTNFTFDGCTNMIMAPSALINVLGSRVLTIHDCHIISCDNMSQGINLSSNARAIIRGSWLGDMQYAVNLHQKSVLTSIDNHFQNNYISINAVAPTNAATMGIGMNVSKCVFEATKLHMAPKYTGQFPLPLSYPKSGINLEKVINISINPDSAHQNIFRNLNSGIVANKTTLSISNCKFRNILKIDNYPQSASILGVALYDRGTSSAFTLSYTGERDSSKKDFVNCSTGILGLGLNLNASRTYMDSVDIGIQAKRSNMAAIDIHQNTINCNVSGISILTNWFADSISVIDNEIRGGYLPYQTNGLGSNAIGIDVEGNNLVQSGVRYLFANNYIYLSQYAKMGVELQYSKSIDLLENFISIDNDQNTQIVGIALFKTEQSTISCNDISGSRINQSNDYPEAGIQYASSLGNIVGMNSMNFIAQGIDVIGICDNGIDQSTFEKNFFGFGFNGLRYRGSAVVNEQFHTGNNWIHVAFSGWGAVNFDTLNAQFFKYSVNGSGNSIPLTRFPQNWFTPDSLPDPQINSGDCNNFGGTNQNPIPAFLKLSSDSLRTMEHIQELNWQSKLNVYTKLIEHPEYLAENADLADFYIYNAATAIHYIAQLNVERDSLLSNQQTLIQNIKSNSIDIFEKSNVLKELYYRFENPNLKEDELDSLLIQNDNLMMELDQSVQLGNYYVEQLANSLQTKVDLISTLTDSIQGSEIYEVNEEQMNGFESYLESNPDDDSLDSKQTLLYNIATQCPLTGGVAVFKARAYFKLINPNLFYDDIGTCIQSGVLYRQKKETNQFVNLFPNPTTGLTNIDYMISDDAKMEISDQMGRTVNIMELKANIHSEKVDLTKFANGYYFYRVQNDSGVISNGKLILVK
jgi:hypothetical protein